MKNDFRNAIRDLIEKLKKRGLTGQYIHHQINKDEINDPTLVSQRAYGSREYADVVMVACGTSGIWEELPRAEIILPTMLQIIQLQQQFHRDG